jgi:periplasmic divalent cation tolerance protein
MVVVLVTAKASDGPTIARELVSRRLAACVNIVSGLVSIYRFEGKIEEDHEVLLIAKTTAAEFENLRRAVIELHPYKVPEVIALDVSFEHTPYGEWLRAQVGGSAS